jgi:p-cumate 2,3-dioxygenase ferredoxin component
MGEFVKVCAVDVMLEGEIAKVLLPDGTDIALYQVDGAIYATSNRCTHGDATLSDEGIINGKTVECTFHNGSFDISTGEAIAMPCEIPLKTYAVRLVDGDVHIEI